ncbi:MAG TPA: hypothetical protein VM223_15100 [Planctomycetota bacterium]|nr:hypothetical protein [Planctomycetota bacterium]
MNREQNDGGQNDEDSGSRYHSVISSFCLLLGGKDQERGEKKEQGTMNNEQ